MRRATKEERIGEWMLDLMRLRATRSRATLVKHHVDGLELPVYFYEAVTADGHRHVLLSPQWQHLTWIDQEWK